LGTMNNFARSLEVPLDVPAAVRTVAAGKVAGVDLGRVDHIGGVEVFATLTSVGVSVEVARRTPHRLKRLIGPPAYAATALAVFPGHAPFQATVRTGDGRSESVFTHQLNVANGRFHAGRGVQLEVNQRPRKRLNWATSRPPGRATVIPRIEPLLRRSLESKPPRRGRSRLTDSGPAVRLREGDVASVQRLYFQQPVPLRRAFRPHRGSHLDLARVPAHGDICQPVVFSVAGASPDHRGIPARFRPKQDVLGPT